MIESVPFYVSAVFILTVFLTVGIFLYATKRAAFSSISTKILSFLIPFWLFFQAVLALGGFYTNIDGMPPRVSAFALLPCVLIIVLLFIFARRGLVERLSLKTLTIIHIIRIQVEFVLLWLFQLGLVPQLMTFEGRNFDILSGITAPVIYWLAFRYSKMNRSLLIGWNVVALLLLLNIVVNALLAFQTPFQKFTFDQPNRAIQFFPFIWLPTVVVPIILFCHLASLWQLLKLRRESKP